MAILSNDFLDMIQNTEAVKEKIDKLDFKITNFCASKDTIERV